MIHQPSDRKEIAVKSRKSPSTAAMSRPLMPTVIVPDNPDHLILAASSTLSDRTDWSAEEKSIATNYDYTQYVPPTCSEFYGSLAVDSESVMPQPAIDGAAADNNWHEKNIRCQTMYSTATDRPHSIRGISKLPDFADETSIAGETFEAGPRLELKEGTIANSYYVVTDDFEQYHDKKRNKKSIFQMARLSMSFGRKKKSEVLPNEINIHKMDGGNSKEKQKKSGLFGRFKSNKKHNDTTIAAPSTPKLSPYYVPSMLTPTSSPYTDNVTPSGLHTFKDTKYTSIEPPKMPSTNSHSSSIFAKQDDLSLTDLTHSDSDTSPENSPSLNMELMPMIVCNVVDDSLSGVDEVNNEAEPVDGSNTVVNAHGDAGATVSDNGAVDGGALSEAASATEPSTSVNEAPFVNPLVLDNDTEIEMEYLESITSSEEVSKMNDPSKHVVAAPTKKKRPAPKPTNEPVFLDVDLTESGSVSTAVFDNDAAPIKSTASQDTTDKKIISKDVREKQTVVERGFAFLSKRSNLEAQSPIIPNENVTPTGVIISEEEIATIQDYERLSPEHVIESQTERNAKVYNRGISIRTKSVVAEAQMRTKMPDTQNDMSPTHSTSQTVELSKLMLMKTNQGVKNIMSFDDTVFNGVSLASDSACDEDGTVQDASIMDYEDERSESSLTFQSNDSTYLSDVSDAGCNIRRVLIDDLNDAVEDVREGVMDMVAAVRSTPVRRQRAQLL
ncbi:hypothetical protein ACHAXN_009942 [Cyclotella atomus]